MKCPIHKIEYNYTCSVCEEELRFRYFDGGIEAFRAGFNGKQDRFNSNRDKEAFENGKKWRKLYEKPKLFSRKL